MTRNPYAAPTPPPRDTPAAPVLTAAPVEPASNAGGPGTGSVATAAPRAAGPAAFPLSAEGQAVAAAAAAPPSGRSVAARLVWRGVGLGLAGHALTMLLPLLVALAIGVSPGSGRSSTSDALSVFVLGGIVAQLFLFATALVSGVRRIIRRDGGVGAGILIGWAAGIPASLVAGIVICVMLAEAGNSF